MSTGGTFDTEDRSVKKIVLFAVLAVAIIVAILFWQRSCIGESLGIGGDDNTNVTASGGKLILPENCQAIELENEDTQVECDDQKMDDEHLKELVRAVIVEEKCNPTQCDRTPTAEITPPVKDKPKTTDSKTSCEDYARETHEPWECLDSRNYRGWSGNRMKSGMCPGNWYVKCMIPGKPSTGNPGPPVSRTPEPESPRMARYEITCEGGKVCDEFYTASLLKNPGARVVTPGAHVRSNGHVSVPGGTQTLVIEAPANSSLEAVNARDTNGEWSVSHGQSQVVNGQETSQPAFPVSVKKNGKKKTMGSGDARKRGDWAYDYENTEPASNGNVPTTSDGAYDFSSNSNEQ